jgi:beta-lactam-binding protein with PASTA domain
MTKGKAILYITASIALASFGFWLYQKQKVKTLNAKVDSLEDAIKQLQEAKNS